MSSVGELETLGRVTSPCAFRTFQDHGPCSRHPMWKWQSRTVVRMSWMPVRGQLQNLWWTAEVKKESIKPSRLGWLVGLAVEMV